LLCTVPVLWGDSAYAEPFLAARKVLGAPRVEFTKCPFTCDEVATWSQHDQILAVINCMEEAAEILRNEDLAGFHLQWCEEPGGLCWVYHPFGCLPSGLSRDRGDKIQVVGDEITLTFPPGPCGLRFSMHWEEFRHSVMREGVNGCSPSN
jgi:hypothetical protein